MPVMPLHPTLTDPSTLNEILLESAEDSYRTTLEPGFVSNHERRTSMEKTSAYIHAYMNTCIHTCIFIGLQVPTYTSRYIIDN